MNETGYTLVELMIVVAILAVFAAISIESAGPAIRSAQEATTKGNLAQLRTAQGIYVTDHENAPLVDLNVLWQQHYITGIPQAYYPTHHVPNTKVGAGDHAAWIASFEEDAAWWLFTDGTRDNTIIANCIHDDRHGKIWTTY